MSSELRDVSLLCTVCVQYLHCLCCFWRAEDLKQHLLDDHINQLLMSAGAAQSVTCKWDACFDVVAADTKVRRSVTPVYVTLSELSLIRWGVNCRGADHLAAWSSLHGGADME